MKLIGLGVCALVTASTAFADTGPELCAAFSDNLARLHCYDAYYGAPSVHFTVDNEPDNLAQFVVAGPDSEGGMEAGIDALEPTTFSPINSRNEQEFALADKRFSITPHRPNYILPATYNASSDFSVYDPLGEAFSDTEIKFQLSIKTLLARDLWRGSSVWVGYTQQSYWQLYADDVASAPFRETNHQPEIFWEVPVNFAVLGWNARVATLALNHQSNGQIDPLSRSWNRVTAELDLDRGPFVLGIKTWKRIVEDGSSDDNPNIEDYMGRVKVGLAYKRQDHLFSAALINNLSSDNRSGVELNWSFPLIRHLKGFVQVYSGYGENMIDMENYSNRIGIGIALNDWL